LEKLPTLKGLEVAGGSIENDPKRL
jgi:hypothetical protein